MKISKKLVAELDKAIYFPLTGPAYGTTQGAYEYGVKNHDALIQRIVKVLFKPIKNDVSCSHGSCLPGKCNQK